MKNYLQEDVWDSDQTFVNVLTNGGFKAFFGDENNKEEVMEVLNALLPENCQVMEIEYLPTERQGQVVDVNKEMHFDYMCRDQSGAVFIVEMQQYKEKHWFKRCVSYASRAYDRQNKRGQEYDVPPVYLIGLMAVEIDHKNPSEWENRFISEYTFREKISHEVLADTIFVIFAELAHFEKEPEECHTRLERMLYILKNSGTMTKESSPKWTDSTSLDRILDKLLIAGFPEDKRIQYENDMYDERRRNGELAAAKEEGIEQGREQGREMEQKKNMETLRNMKELGVAVEIIAKATGLSIEEVERL